MKISAALITALLSLFMAVTVQAAGSEAAQNATARSDERLQPDFKTESRELQRHYPLLANNTLIWEAKLVAIKANGETISEQPVSLAGLLANGQLRIPREHIDSLHTGSDGLTQLHLHLKLPVGVRGDSTMLELVLSDHETQGIKRLSLSLHGNEGLALYEYQSFSPPIITLSAGLTELPNSRLRVGENVLRFDSQKPSVVAIELKNSEIAAYSGGQLTRKMPYTGKVGELKAISLIVPGLAVLDSIKLFENGMLVLVEDFDREPSAKTQ